MTTGIESRREVESDVVLARRATSCRRTPGSGTARARRVEGRVRTTRVASRLPRARSPRGGGVRWRRVCSRSAGLATRARGSARRTSPTPPRPRPSRRRRTPRARGEASSPPEAAREDPWCSDALRAWQTEPLLPAVADAARRLRATVFSPRGAPPLSTPPSPLDLDPPTAVTPLDPSRVPSPLHATLGRILRAAANARDRDDPRDVRAAAARMELVCRAVLVFCGALLERTNHTHHTGRAARSRPDADEPHTTTPAAPRARKTHARPRKNSCPPSARTSYADVTSRATRA